VTARLLGRRWHEWSPPSVLQWFSPRSLAELARQQGLEVVARGRPRKRIGAAHAKSLLRHKLGTSSAGRLAGRVLDYALPSRVTLPYPSEDLFWLLLRKRG
jgi:hypothetical protein